MRNYTLLKASETESKNMKCLNSLRNIVFIAFSFIYFTCTPYINKQKLKFTKSTRNRIQRTKTPLSKY